jgi:uncharacterized protein (TIGR03000 family)
MKKVKILSGVAAIAVAFSSATTVQAGHGSWGGSHGSSGGGSYGSSGGSYGSSGGSSGGSYGSWGGSSGSSGSSFAGHASSGGSGSSGQGHHVGPLKRLIAKIHDHHAAKVAARRSHYSSGGASYGSSGGGSYGSSGGSYGSSGGSYGSSGGSYGSSGGSVVMSYRGGSSGHGSSGGSSGGAVISGYSSEYSSGYSTVPSDYDSVPVYGAESQESTVAPPQPNEPPAQTDAPATDVEAKVEGDSAILTVAVPEDAVVTVNGLPTKSSGPIRQFMSTGLEVGFVYKYVVEVRYADSDKAETRTVRLRAGAAERLVFSGPNADNVVEREAAQNDLETVVTIRVPADAKVSLAGNDTNGSGEVRTFRTRQLAEGEAWSNYTIRVTATINGSSISQERSLNLVAGSAHELTFDFESADVANR